MRDPDVGLGIVREHRIAAVGVAGAAGEIAAGDVDLDAIAGAERVMDVREVDGHPIDRVGLQTLRRRDRESRYIARTTPSISSIARPSGSTSISLATKSVSGQSD